MGLDPSWNCSGAGDGEPIANIPVLALTVTSTISQGLDFPSQSLPKTRSSPSTTESAKLTGSTVKPGPSRFSLPPTATAPMESSTAAPTHPSTTLTNPARTIAGQVVTANVQGQYLVGGQTLIPGGTPITISGTVYSLSPSDKTLQVGSWDLLLGGQAPVITIDDGVVTANAQGGYVIGSQTLVPGGGAITISGIAYSLSPSGTALQVGPSWIPLFTPSPTPVLTLGGHVIPANSLGEYIVDSQTLTPNGGPITILGTVYSMFPSGTALQVGSSRMRSASPTRAITVGGQTVTPNLEGAYVIGSQTLKPGQPPVTISGTPISIAADGKTMVVGGKTEVMAKTTSQGIGGLVWSGVGGSNGPTNGSRDGRAAETDAVQFTGGAPMSIFGLSWTAQLVVCISILVASTFIIL